MRMIEADHYRTLAGVESNSRQQFRVSATFPVESSAASQRVLREEGIAIAERRGVLIQTTRNRANTVAVPAATG